MMPSSRHHLLIWRYFLTLVLVSVGIQWNGCVNAQINVQCKLFDTNVKKPCNPGEWVGYQNIPILNGVYCFNNGTGICKAFAGRFEFYFNVWTQTFLGPVEKSQYVDSFGYHERVPNSYMVNGSVLYADRPINWSIYFTRNKPTEYNLLSSTSFNWCKYVTSNNWPYRSSFLDHDKRHQIYFFNRQSCIYDPVSRDLQHYNTRFLHTSRLRIDLDYNPTIFAMEDNKAGNEIRLVKHKRQHWYEVEWKLLKNPRAGLKYFIEMSGEHKEPLIVDGKGPLLRKEFYQNLTDICISDFFTSRTATSDTNNKLVQTACGVDGCEIADYIESRNLVYEVGLHSIPRWPTEVQYFYNVEVTSPKDWESWANDGYSFSATTTIPLGNKRYTVISLFSFYKSKQPADTYDEHYPVTYLSKYEVREEYGLWKGVKSGRRQDNSTEQLNLNYVDDIAYLHECKTILVIFGPLYTEFKVDEFNLGTKTPLGSIYDLGLNEMTTAFFAKRGGNQIYFLHRTNYIAEHTYICGSPLVTAKKVGGYKYKVGLEAMPIFNGYRQPDYNYNEERHFQVLGVFKGTVGKPDAPDAKKYPWDNEEVKEPEADHLPGWVWVLVAIGIAILIVMFILGFMAFRRLRRKRYLAKTLRSELPSLSQLSGADTNRSAMPHGGVSKATVRSGRLQSSSVGPTATGRTGLSSSRPYPSTTSTSRSALPSKSSPARPSSAGTKRSGVSSRSGSRRSNSTRRSANLSGSSPSKGSAGGTVRSQNSARSVR